MKVIIKQLSVPHLTLNRAVKVEIEPNTVDGTYIATDPEIGISGSGFSLEAAVQNWKENTVAEYEKWESKNVSSPYKDKVLKLISRQSHTPAPTA